MSTQTAFSPGETDPTSMGNSRLAPSATNAPAEIQATWPAPHSGGPGPTPNTPVPTPIILNIDPARINVLLIGSDRRSSSAYRTDTLILVSIDTTKDTVTMLSIPRDLYVYIPGWTMQRINTAFIHGENNAYPGGGPGLLKDTILYNFGVAVDYWAMVDFQGFREIVDTLGGIDLPLACPFTEWHVIDPEGDLEDEENWHLITLDSGVVHMDGNLALWYARARARSSDLDRNIRQQAVLRALFTRGLQLDVIPHLAELFEILKDSISTDITLSDILHLAPVAARLGSADIRSFFINEDYIRGWRTPQGASVLVPKQGSISAFMQSIFVSQGSSGDPNSDALIEIWNGSSHPYSDVLAADWLNKSGFETQIAIPDHRQYTETHIIDFTSSQDPGMRQVLMTLLRLPEDRWVSDPSPDASIQYRLILGDDFNPCLLQPSN